MTSEIDLALPIAAGSAVDFSRYLDAERLIRLHPHWHVETLIQEGDHCRARLKDHATEKPLEVFFRLSFPGRGELLMVFEDGPAAKIHFYPENERLYVSITPRNQPPSPEKEQDLFLWLRSIRQYLRLYLQSTLHTLFIRFLMNKALLKMNPSQRKICMMLYRVTILEIVVILIIVIGYFYFGRP